MNALKIVLIPALLALVAGAAMATDAPEDAKMAAKPVATSASAPHAKKKHHAKKAAPAADAAKTDAPAAK